MIDYRMMDETCLTCYCLHGGPIPLEETQTPETKPTWGESNAKVPKGTIAGHLRALCQAYGSCAVLAIDEKRIVGTLRFYPSELDESLQDLQREECVKAIASFNVTNLPSKQSLSPKSLHIHCFQVAEVQQAATTGKQSRYQRCGIGTTMLKRLITWAHEKGWDEIRAEAIGHIRPLMSWMNCLSVERYRALGFEIGEGVSDNAELSRPCSC